MVQTRITDYYGPMRGRSSSSSLQVLPPSSRRGSKPRKGRAKRNFYRKGKKQLNVRRGNPIRETKTRSGEEVYAGFDASVRGLEGVDEPNATTGAHGGRLHFWPTAMTNGIGGIVRVIPLYSLWCQQQGVDETRMTGDACFVKYMKMKGRVTWPTSPNITLTQACDLRIIHGFIKNSPDLNGRQSFRALNPMPPENFSVLNCIQWVYDELQPYFDNLSDDLKFIPKRESNLKILGHRKLVPALRQWTARQQTTDGATGDTAIGTFPDTKFSCTWPMMRKYHYEAGAENTFENDAAGLATNIRRLRYINSAQWIPFAVFYAPQGGGLLPTVDGEPGSLPGFQYNDQIWFQDP